MVRGQGRVSFPRRYYPAPPREPIRASPTPEHDRRHELGERLLNSRSSAASLRGSFMMIRKLGSHRAGIPEDAAHRHTAAAGAAVRRRMDFVGRIETTIGVLPDAAAIRALMPVSALGTCVSRHVGLLSVMQPLG